MPRRVHEPSGRLRAARHRLLALAAAHPAAGQPRGLVALGPGGLACLSVADARDLTGDRWSVGSRSVVHRPGAPDASGRTASFELRGEATDAAGNEVVLILDATGAAR